MLRQARELNHQANCRNLSADNGTKMTVFVAHEALTCFQRSQVVGFEPVAAAHPNQSGGQFE